MQLKSKEGSGGGSWELYKYTETINGVVDDEGGLPQFWGNRLRMCMGDAEVKCYGV